MYVVLCEHEPPTVPQRPEHVEPESVELAGLLPEYHGYEPDAHTV